jgi:hypothetical protein
VGKPEETTGKKHVGGRIILKRFLERWHSTDTIDTAQDRDQWRALVNTVKSFVCHKMLWKFLSSCTVGSFSREAQLHE